MPALRHMQGCPCCDGTVLGIGLALNWATHAVNLELSYPPIEWGKLVPMSENSFPLISTKNQLGVPKWCKTPH